MLLGLPKANQPDWLDFVHGRLSQGVCPDCCRYPDVQPAESYLYDR